jgi:O-antigen/teichoic acid export membrane protein
MHLFGPIWTAPIVLGALTIVGLVSALVGDGAWDALSALALGIVALVGAWCGLRRPKKRHRVRR